MGYANFQLLETYGSGALSTSIIVFALVMLFILGVAGIGFRFWSNSGLKTGISVGEVDHLFLKTKYCVAGEKREGYLRYLASDGATLVSYNGSVSKFADIEIDLSSTFDQNMEYIRGKVIKCKSLGGFPESWMIEVKFQSRTEKEKQYIQKVLLKTQRIGSNHLDEF
ncbi:MAG: hypothetical protein HQK54_03170 [Oligoflexales bacterium]|nr:hypothetical protein [Oligoflexales bacterium]